jgi:hypothetical protein
MAEVYGIDLSRMLLVDVETVAPYYMQSRKARSRFLFVLFVSFLFAHVELHVAAKGHAAPELGRLGRCCARDALVWPQVAV